MNLTTYFRTWRGVLPLLVAVWLAGCATLTTEQVKQIVADSNAAALSADLLPGPANPQGGTGASNWQEASKKIEAFIAANPDQKTTNASLRVRQAVMLLQNNQLNLARAAFNEAALENLRGSTRDAALKQLQEELLWWYAAAPSKSSVDFNVGKAAQAKIDGVLKSLSAPESEGIRDYVTAIRAWIGLRMANDAAGAGVGEGYLVEALNSYAATLPTGETTGWLQQKGWPSGMTFETAIAATNRRHFRADDLVAGAKKAIANNALKVDFSQIKDEYFRAGLSR